MAVYRKTTFLTTALLGLCTALHTQSALFDYQREELPAMSQNRLTYCDARLLRYSGDPLMAESLLSCLINPATMPPDNQAVITFSFKTHSAFQYWGINEGILVSPNAVSEQNFGIGAAAISHNTQSLTFAAGYAESALRAFPSFVYENSQTVFLNTFRIRYNGNFTGPEKTYFLSLKKALTMRLHAGITFSYSKTVRTVSVSEIMDQKPAEASDWNTTSSLVQQERHELSILTLTPGISFQPVQAFQCALSLALPISGKADREIFRELTVPQDSRNSRFTARDSINEPWRVTASFMTVIPVKCQKFTLRSGFNLLFSHWSGYRFHFFERDLTEKMRNTLSASFSLSARLKTGLGIWELGGSIRHDPQALATPQAALWHWSGGISLRDNWLEVDLTVAHLAAQFDGVYIPHKLLSCTGSFRF